MTVAVVYCKLQYRPCLDLFP